MLQHNGSKKKALITGINGAVFCTDSFSKEDNIRLVSLINEQKIPCHLTPRNRIRIEGNGGIEKLLSYIGRSPVICYQYKWGEYC